MTSVAVGGNEAEGNSLESNVNIFDSRWYSKNPHPQLTEERVRRMNDRSLLPLVNVVELVREQYRWMSANEVRLAWKSCSQ